MITEDKAWCYTGSGTIAIFLLKCLSLEVNEEGKFMTKKKRVEKGRTKNTQNTVR